MHIINNQKRTWHQDNLNKKIQILIIMIHKDLFTFRSVLLNSFVAFFYSSAICYCFKYWNNYFLWRDLKIISWAFAKESLMTSFICVTMCLWVSFHKVKLSCVWYVFNAIWVMFTSHHHRQTNHHLPFLLPLPLLLPLQQLLLLLLVHRHLLQVPRLLVLRIP